MIKTNKTLSIKIPIKKPGTGFNNRSAVEEDVIVITHSGKKHRNARVDVKTNRYHSSSSHSESKSIA